MSDKHSQHSGSVTAPSAAAVARAKAEAAKARATYGEREAAMKIDKARLEASLEALTLEKEATAAIAEAETLEAAEEYVNDEALEQHMISQVVFNGPRQAFCLDSLLCALLNYVNGLPAPSPNPEPVRMAKAEPLIGSRPPSTAGGYIPWFNMQRQHQG